MQLVEKIKRPRSKHTIKRKETIAAWLFLAPMLIGFLLFFAFPFVYAIYISFTEFSLFDSPTFIGLDNFFRAFDDAMFKRSLVNALYNAIGVPVGIVIALILSSLLVNNKRFSLLFRTFYFIPTICGAVAITFIWQWLYAPIYGLISSFLTNIGIPSFSFLGQEHFMISMIIMGIWSGMGISILLLFAAMKNVPKELYEAASIDGANNIQKFRHITLKAVSPITFYILITGISGSFQEFTRFQVMRGGSYNDWSIMPVWWIYNHTTTLFGYEMGYASALGVLLGLVIILLSAINFGASRYWVNYD